MESEAVHIAMLLPDRRQSETALKIARGTSRLLRSLGFACVAELPLPSGRRADLVALNERGEIWIIEIKSSLEDLRVLKTTGATGAIVGVPVLAVDFPRHAGIASHFGNVQVFRSLRFGGGKIERLAGNVGSGGEHGKERFAGVGSQGYGRGDGSFRADR